jgi:hypothetical protein
MLLRLSFWPYFRPVTARQKRLCLPKAILDVEADLVDELHQHSRAVFHCLPLWVFTHDTEVLGQYFFGTDHASYGALGQFLHRVATGVCGLVHRVRCGGATSTAYVEVDYTRIWDSRRHDWQKNNDFYIADLRKRCWSRRWGWCGNRQHRWCHNLLNRCRNRGWGNRAVLRKHEPGRMLGRTARYPARSILAR